MAVVAVRDEPDALMIEPKLAVTATIVAPPVILPLINALAPRLTLRPALTVIAPNVEVTVPLIVTSPIEVLDVIPIFPIVVMLMPVASVRLRPELKVIVPDVVLTAALMVKSLPAPFEDKLIVPLVAAVTALLTINDPAMADKEIFPKIFVVMPLVVRFPVAAVKVKFMPLNTAFTSVDVNPLVIA